MISIDAGKLVVTVGKLTGLNGNEAERLTIQLDTQHGPPLIITKKDVMVGTAVRLEDTENIVVATLTFADGEVSRVRITEHVVEE